MNMYRLPCAYLLIFYCLTFVCVYGAGHEPSPSCEVGLMVRRGTAWKATPHQRVTVKCPVKHCGESLNVTWCKLLDTDKCEQIKHTENVEIKQNDKPDEDKLISLLTFKRISVHDDGLYRCDVKGFKVELVSHTINISVSDLNQEVKNTDNNADESPGAAAAAAAGDEEEAVPWLPYFSICLIIAVLVATLTVLTLVRFYGWKQVLTFNRTKGQEMSTHIIPDLPKGSAPSTDFLQTHFPFLNDIHFPSTAESPPSHPPTMTNRNQPAVSNAAGESQASDHAVYAVINHRQSGIPTRVQHTATNQNKNAAYASINVS